MKIPNKRELQEVAHNHLPDIDFKDFMRIYKEYNAEPYSVLVNDPIPLSDNSLLFRNNRLE